MHTKFWLERFKETDHLEDTGIDGLSNIRTDPVERGWEDAEWMHLTQVTDQWRTL